jgi:hypothetical protein
MPRNSTLSTSAIRASKQRFRRLSKPSISIVYAHVLQPVATRDQTCLRTKRNILKLWRKMTTCGITFNKRCNADESSFTRHLREVSLLESVRELAACKSFPLLRLTSYRYLLARLRLNHIIGGGNMPIPEDIDCRSKKFPGNQVRDFYQMIMRGIVKIGEPTTSHALQALCWIWHAKTPLTMWTLCEAVGAPSIDAILGPCMSLVILSETTDLFQFSHNTTVTEFLTDSQNFEDLGVCLITHLDLAKACLEYLDSSKFMLSKVPD